MRHLFSSASSAGRRQWLVSGGPRARGRAPNRLRARAGPGRIRPRRPLAQWARGAGRRPGRPLARLARAAGARLVIGARRTGAGLVLLLVVVAMLVVVVVRRLALGACSSGPRLRSAKLLLGFTDCGLNLNCLAINPAMVGVGLVGITSGSAACRRY